MPGKCVVYNYIGGKSVGTTEFTGGYRGCQSKLLFSERDSDRGPFGFALGEAILLQPSIFQSAFKQ